MNKTCSRKFSECSVRVDECYASISPFAIFQTVDSLFLDLVDLLGS